MPANLHDTPAAPSGDSQFDLFLRWVWDTLTRRHKLINIPGVVTWNYTAQGVRPEFTLRSSASFPVNPFLITKGSTWLTAKVATGYIITTGAEFEPDNYDTELTLTSGEAHNWIVMDLTATTATFSVSTTTPTWANDKIPIGWVDTTDTANQSAVITQMTRDHIFNPCLT